MAVLGICSEGLRVSGVLGVFFYLHLSLRIGIWEFAFLWLWGVCLLVYGNYWGVYSWCVGEWVSYVSVMWSCQVGLRSE